jgi:hypothetical protein
MIVNARDAKQRDVSVSMNSTSGVGRGKYKAPSELTDSIRVRGLDLPRANATPSRQHHEVADTSADIGRSIFPVSSLRPHVAESGATEDAVYFAVEADENTDDGPSLDPAQHTANPLPFISRADRPFSLRSLLDSSVRPRHDPKKMRTINDDLITQGVLSLSMATRLFEL